MRTKVVSSFIFPRAFKQKIKELRPKVTKIASRGSCLKQSFFCFCVSNNLENLSFWSWWQIAVSCWLADSGFTQYASFHEGKALETHCLSVNQVDLLLKYWAPFWLGNTSHLIALLLEHNFLMSWSFPGRHKSVCQCCLPSVPTLYWWEPIVWNSKLALVGIIPYQLFSLSSDKERRTDSRIRQKKHSAAPPGIEPRILRILVARSNHWATKPQRELRVNSRLSPSCQFFFHYGFVAQWLERATRIRKILGLIPGGAALCFFVWSGCQFFYLCRSWKRRVDKVWNSSAILSKFWCRRFLSESRLT